MPKQRTQITVGALIGKKVRELRDRTGMRQEDVAKEMQRWGFEGWTRSSVAALEAGTRGLTAEELLMMPWVFVRLSGEPTNFVGLLASKDDDLQITERVAILPGAIGDILNPGRVARYAGDDASAPIPGEADYKLARDLDVVVPLVLEAASDLWGRSLSSERDRRLQETVSEDLSAASKRALRGHITRRLRLEATQRIEEIQIRRSRNRARAARDRQRKAERS